MWKTGSISIPEFLQPNNEVWEIINEFVVRWNDSYSNLQLKNDHGNAWYITLGRDIFYIYPVIVQALKELESKVDVFYVAHYEKHYEEEDFLKADFIKFSSWQIEAATPFILNDDEISPAGGDCPKCGSWSPLTHLSKPPLLIIDESLLKSPMEELTKADDEEWDLVYASTHFMISAGFKRILEENEIKGYTLLPTISHKTGKESKKMFQLIANKATNITALPEGVSQQPFCDTCGRAKAPYDFDFAVDKEWIGDDDFFARGNYKGDSLIMSNRLFKLVRKHQLTGIRPQYPVSVI